MDESLDHQPVEKRRRRTAIAILLALIAAGAFAGFRSFQRNVPLGLGQAELTDGTILVLHAALFDPKSEFTAGVPTLGVVTPFSRRDTVLNTSDAPTIRFALSRHDPKTGDYLDFPTFSHMEVTDRYGGVVWTWDQHGLQVVSRNGRSGKRNGQLAGPPISAGVGFRFFTHQMHRFQCDTETTSLRVMGQSGSVLAEFPIPVPTSLREKVDAPEFNWSEESEGTTVQIDSLRMGHASARETWVVPDFSVSRRGQSLPRSEWRDSDWFFTDSLGNEFRTGEFALPSEQHSWQLRFNLFRHQSAGFDSSYPRRTIGTIQVPKTSQTETTPPLDSLVKAVTFLPPNSRGTIETDGFFQSRPRDLGGWVCCTPVSPHALGQHVGSNGWNGDAFDGSYSAGTDPTRDSRIANGLGVKSTFRCTWDSSQPRTTIETECDLPVLVLSTLDLVRNEAVNVAAIDDQGREILIHPLQHVFKRMPAYACEVLPDSKSLEISIIQQQARPVQFQLPPPRDALDGTQRHYELLPNGDDWKTVEQ